MFCKVASISLVSYIILIFVLRCVFLLNKKIH